MFGWPVVDSLFYETNKPIALSFDSCHNPRAIDSRRANINTEFSSFTNLVIYLGRSDQQFTRHAADARTGGTVVRRLDNQ